LLVLGLHVRIESGRDQRGHVGGLADAGSVAADEGATAPATWLSRHRRKACEACGLRRFEAAELGNFDEQGAGREAARDVGEAMARNPAPLIIPCHRVLAAGGKIGGFSAPGGSKTKARMLELEGVRLRPPEAAQQAFSF
jgi:O-6-methylguanine DNA methyltransferase